MTITEHLFAGSSGISRAALLLRAGELVAFATETVYGLGGNATSDQAIAAIFAAKRRPVFNPLIVHVADIAAARRIAVLSKQAERLAQAFWPGPLTLVLPLREDAGISKLVTAGQPTIAVRVPAHDIARDLLGEADVPIAAPSANPSGRISPTTAAHVLAGLSGRIGAVLDAGPCTIGVESTIVDATGPLRLLRPGGVPIEAFVDVSVAIDMDAPKPSITPNAPGQLASHYAPVSAVRLDATQAVGSEVFLGFGGTPGSDVDLSPSGDLLEAAANLFAMLHALDGQDRPIAVAPIPDHGLGRAINDRLRRAAAPRD